MPSLNGEGLLLVGNPDPVHVGAHFLKAASVLGLRVRLCDVRLAFRAHPLVAKFNWWLRGRRPSRLHDFGRGVVEACRAFRPTWLVSIGIAPLERAALEEIGRCGVTRMNFLTDDPWNPVHRATWFLETLAQYDQVYTPRRTNVDELYKAGCRHVDYLPFAYDPEVHFPEQPADEAERQALASDVAIIGGADADRVPYLGVLASSGLRLALYGGYWERYRATRPFARGLAGPEVLRKATAAAKVVLCLVRRANRDGHSMRSYEGAALKSCMLVEDTAEHRDLFGPDDEAVAYFRSRGEMIERARQLVADEARRRRLAEAAYRQIVSGANTYRDRLAAMLGRANVASPF
jgi:spore maturation protein CgeB